MATDFFARQDAARRNTTRLVVLFVLAVLAIMVSIDLLLAATFGYAVAIENGPRDYWAVATDPGLVSLSVFGTLIVVGGGSLYKIAQLRGGGRVIAEQLGGRLLHPGTSDPMERRILNVVEEMAIASGTPTPPVYLLDNEQGINAFAAGYTPNDAVIGITRGTAEFLTRDELQGVVAHEFSHILNGDMRLNIRLIGILHGILIIGMLGYFILRSSVYSGRRRRSSRDQGGGTLAILALGAGLAAVGFFGTFFGNLIKAAVSRQREFLADASAVQFTRNPDGIAGALKKIGGAAAGSRVDHPSAPEASHLFFGRATGGLSALFSTHPPLEMRIRRLDPSWDGVFPRVEGVAPMASGGATGLPGAASFAESRVSVAGADRGRLEHALEAIGAPGPAHIRYAAQLLESLPPALVEAAHEPYGARALMYALLLDRDARLRQLQLARLAETADRGVYGETLRLMPFVDALDPRARLPLVELAIPALRELTSAQEAAFRQNLAALAQADDRIDLFEWSLQRIVRHALEANRPRARAEHRALPSVETAIETLLAAVRHAGRRREAAGPSGPPLRLGAVDAALAALEHAPPRVKRRALHAAVEAVTGDGAVTVAEAELLRALSASLDVPVPPVVAAVNSQRSSDK